MKKIAFLITDSGIDGRDKTTIQAAFYDETERDKAFDADKNKAYLSKAEQIIDPQQAQAAALAKLDGLDKLMLGLASDKATC